MKIAIRLVALALLAALPGAALAQEQKQPQQLERKTVTLETEAGPVVLTLLEHGVYEATLTHEGRRYVGYGAQLELDGKGGGANRLHLAFYEEERLREPVAPRQGVTQSLGGRPAQQQTDEEGEDDDVPAIEMTIDLTGEESCTCECPTILGRAVTITGNAARLLAGMMLASGEFLRHMVVDKLGKELIVDKLAKKVIGEMVAKRFFRDLVGRKIFRDVIAKKVFRDFLGKKVLRDAVGKKFFRDWIWRGGILRVGRFFSRELLHTRKPCKPTPQVTEIKINRRPEPVQEQAPATDAEDLVEEDGLPGEPLIGGLDR